MDALSLHSKILDGYKEYIWSFIAGASPIVAKNQFHRNSRVSFLSATSMASM
jgi:hypothetical protein